MPDAPDIVLCSKLCRHNPVDPNVYLLMILSVNTYANVILERSLRANEGHIGVNESVLTVMKPCFGHK